MFEKIELRKMVGPLMADAYLDSTNSIREGHWTKAVECGRVYRYWHKVMETIERMPELVTELEMVAEAGRIENELVRADEDFDAAQKTYGAEYYRALGMFMPAGNDAEAPF